jgi:hypothetical protein
MKVKKYTSPATVSRRQFLFQAMAGAAGIRAVALADNKPTAPGLPRDGFLPDELRAMEATAAAFMKKHQVPGLSVAIARKGRLVYAKCWCVNLYHNWWHMGSLPGTITVMVRTSGQFCWAALTNTRNRDTKSPIGADLDVLVWQMVGKITRWSDRDMF